MTLILNVPAQNLLTGFHFNCDIQQNPRMLYQDLNLLVQYRITLKLCLHYVASFPVLLISVKLLHPSVIVLELAKTDVNQKFLLMVVA